MQSHPMHPRYAETHYQSRFPRIGVIGGNSGGEGEGGGWARLGTRHPEARPGRNWRGTEGPGAERRYGASLQFEPPATAWRRIAVQKVFPPIITAISKRVLPVPSGLQNPVLLLFAETLTAIESAPRALCCPAAPPHCGSNTSRCLPFRDSWTIAISSPRSCSTRGK